MVVRKEIQEQVEVKEFYEIIQVFFFWLSQI